MAQELAELLGRITRIVQRGSNSSPGVFIVHTKNLKKDFTVVCPFFCPVDINDSFYGVVTPVMHPRYGTVLEVVREPFVEPCLDRDSLVRCFIMCLRGTGFSSQKGHELYDHLITITQNPDEIITYLSDMSIKWNKFNNESLFLEFSGIVSNHQMIKLMEWWYRNRVIRRLYLLGLTKREIDDCSLSAVEMYNRCITNPLTLPHISQEKAVTILARLNRIATPEQLYCGLIVRKIYSMLTERAWVATPSSLILEVFPDATRHIEMLKNEYEVTMNYRSLYLKRPYTVETTLADYFVNQILETRKGVSTAHQILPHFFNPTLTDEQKEAIYGALNSRVCIITGGAGTGKTTILKEIVQNLDLHDKKYCIASYTGKAVSRIREVIQKRSPSTIHMLISRVRHPYEYAIIDEASMVTTDLMLNFLEAYPSIRYLILVGDINQLPPIGWGFLMEQLIKTQSVQTYTLTYNHRIHREGGNNGILINSHEIATLISENDSERPFEFVSTDNFLMIPGSIQRIHDVITMLYQNQVIATQVTIISPYNRDLDELNRMSQSVFNDSCESSTDFRGKVWRKTDRVMLTANNYDINVFNGEEGIVVETDITRIGVQFADMVVHYFSTLQPPDEHHPNPPGELTLYTESLIHSYAISVHRSQGSEWDYIVLYIPPDTRLSGFLNRNLLYTSITRARRGIWIVGDILLLNQIPYQKAPFRYDNLADRIVKLIQEREVAVESTPLIPDSANDDVDSSAEYTRQILAST